MPIVDVVDVVNGNCKKRNNHLTDKDIVKALHQCSIYEFDYERVNCKDCPLNGCDYCQYELCDFAIELIEKQQIEIESLKIANEKMYQALKKQIDLCKNRAWRKLKRYKETRWSEEK